MSVKLEIIEEVVNLDEPEVKNKTEESTQTKTLIVSAVSAVTVILFLLPLCIYCLTKNRKEPHKINDAEQPEMSTIEAKVTVYDPEISGTPKLKRYE